MCLPQLKVFGFAVPDVRANVTELGHGVQGLLGMDFLSYFNFEIRPAERRIFVEKIAH